MEFPAPDTPIPYLSARQMVEVDLNVIDYLDEQLRVLEQDLAMKAKAHDAGA